MTKYKTTHTAVSNSDGIVTTNSVTVTPAGKTITQLHPSVHFTREWGAVFGKSRETDLAVVTVILDGVTI